MHQRGENKSTKSQLDIARVKQSCRREITTRISTCIERIRSNAFLCQILFAKDKQQMNLLVSVNDAIRLLEKRREASRLASNSQFNRFTHLYVVGRVCGLLCRRRRMCNSLEWNVSFYRLNKQLSVAYDVKWFREENHSFQHSEVHHWLTKTCAGDQFLPWDKVTNTWWKKFDWRDREEAERMDSNAVELKTEEGEEENSIAEDLQHSQWITNCVVCWPAELDLHV